MRQLLTITLGWSALQINGKAVRLSRNGSLQGYRSFIAFDRRTGVCVAATWTLTKQQTEDEAAEAIHTALAPILDGT